MPSIGRKVCFQVHACQSLGPFQRRFPCVGEIIHLVPGNHPIQTFAGLAVLPSLFHVHFDAETAAISLRCLKLN